jgi:hypothetical protein
MGHAAGMRVAFAAIVLCASTGLVWGWGCDKPTGSSGAPSATAAATTGLVCRDNPLPTKKGDKIVSCVLAKDQPIGELLCKAGGFAELHDTGSLKRCNLAESKNWRGIPCNAGRPAHFHQDGSLESCTVTDTHEMGGVVCKYEIEVYPNGKLRRCRLDKDMKLGGRSVPQRTFVTFSGAGKLRKLEFPPDRATLHDGKVCVHMTFDESGKITGCVGPSDRSDTVESLSPP